MYFQFWRNIPLSGQKVWHFIIARRHGNQGKKDSAPKGTLISSVSHHVQTMVVGYLEIYLIKTNL